MILGKKYLIYNMCLTFDKIFVWNTSHSKKNSALICLEVLGVVFQRKKIHTSRNPEQYSSSGSQSNWSTTPVILGVPTGTFSAALTEVIPWFSSVVRQMPGYNLQRRGMLRSLQKLGNNFYAVSPSLTLVWPLWVRIPESLPTKVVPPNKTCCHVSSGP